LLREVFSASKVVVSGCTARRCLSSLSTSRANTVFWLNSGDIFRNLAFEATLFADKQHYQNDSAGGRRLADAVLWKSDPCVVIGLHQNAWLEANPQEVQRRGWRLARRMSGGGAVFHDFGNLNVSFVESRSTLERRKCMEFLQRVLMRHWAHLNVFVGPRYDLWLLPAGLRDADNPKEVPAGALKFSGSASRFSSAVALHHCTMLFNSDLQNLSAVLTPALAHMETKASRSVRSHVANLKIPGEELKTVLVDALRSWLSMDSPTEETSKVIYVNPGDEARWVDGAEFAKNLQTFSSWEWVFGTSPKFTIPLRIAADRTIHVQCQKGRFVGFQEEETDVSDAALSSWLRQLAHALSESPCKRNAWLVPIYAFLSTSAGHLSTQQIEIISQLRRVSASF
uniref:BPL/LPL catalytic domain-containing protein n=2 Tax=Schistocephalus solidus TaxID=70667 RepID=A0A183SDM0_SCHSO